VVAQSVQGLLGVGALPQAAYRTDAGASGEARDEVELDVVRAVANARVSVGDALETLR
jgi:hypothetical protein